MSAPTVACVMLANGRPDMVKRAVKCFRAKTYENATLFIWDQSLYGKPSGSALDYSDYKTLHLHARTPGSIGWMRNAANEFGGHKYGNDIICHWDSDDWSHPNRIAEQVALLQSSGAECVGYDEMLFWNRAPGQFCGSWLYRAAIPNYAIGTSMCYWRSTWDRRPFPDRSEGCDDLEWFNRGVKIFSGSSVPELTWGRNAVPVSPEDIGAEPRMIASIHGGNTCARINVCAREWARVPEWDGYCRTEMAL